MEGAAGAAIATLGGSVADAYRRRRTMQGHGEFLECAQPRWAPSFHAFCTASSSSSWGRSLQMYRKEGGDVTRLYTRSGRRDDG